jgi:hypothetical protein
MTRRTLFCLGFTALLGLAGCQNQNAEITAAPTPIDITGWRLVSGRAPSQAEFAALTATCEERSGSGPLDDCLANLGLKHSP